MCIVRLPHADPDPFAPQARLLATDRSSADYVIEDDPKYA